MGGDWYDVFHLPSGWLGVVVGDVSGHGLAAAVVMGRLRSALRAYALECADPADVLTRLDRKVRHFEAGMMATAVYAMIAPGGERVLVSLAGHPPPMLAAPGGDAVTVQVPVDLPLGTGAHGTRRMTVVDVPPGGVLVFYTDGLVERRGELIDVGIGRLGASIAAAPADEVCAAVMAKLVGSESPTDDMALLVLRRRDAEA